MGAMLYFGKCCQIFRGKSKNIPGNIFKHFGECCQTFHGISSNIFGDVFKHSGEWHQIFLGMASKVPGNVTESQMDETLESTDLFRDGSIRIDKTSHDDLGNLANEL